MKQEIFWAELSAVKYFHNYFMKFSAKEGFWKICGRTELFIYFLGVINLSL